MRLYMILFVGTHNSTFNSTLSASHCNFTGLSLNSSPVCKELKSLWNSQLAFKASRHTSILLLKLKRVQRI